MLTEHKRNCRFGYTEKSAVAEHAYRKEDRRIWFVSLCNFNRKEEDLKISRTRNRHQQNQIVAGA